METSTRNNLLRSAWEDWRFLGAIVLISALLHSLHIWFMRRSPDFGVPILDSLDYVHGALGLLNGQQSAYGFFHSPLYLIFVASILKVFGHNLVFIRVAQVLLAAATCVLLYAIGARIFSRATARIAVAAWAVYGPVIFYDAQLLNVALILFLYLLALLLVLQACASQSTVAWLAAGAAIGLAAVARADILTFAIAVASGVVWRTARRGSSTRKVALDVAALASGVGAALIVVGAATYQLSGRFAVLPASGAINFYQGNNPDYKQTIGVRPESWNQIVDLSVLEENIGSAESGMFFYRKAFNFMSSRPGAYLGNLLYKVRTLLGGYELPDTFDIYTTRRFSPIMSALVWRAGWLAFPYVLLPPLAILGMFLTRQRLDQTWALWAFLTAMLVSLIGYWNCSRYRLSIVPILILFASESVLWLWSKRRSLFERPTVVFAAALLSITVTASAPYDHFSKAFNFEAETYTLAGETLLSEGQPDKGLNYLREGVALDPNSSFNHWKLGSALLKNGNPDLAAPELEKAVDINPRLYAAYQDLGIALSSIDKHAEAIESFSSVIKINPAFYQAYPNLAREFRQTGNIKMAAYYFSKALEMNPQDASVYNDVGVLLINQNKTQNAIEFFAQAVTLDPNFETAKRNLAMAQQLLQQKAAPPPSDKR
jgi:Tfp pilus assembly protein PilF